MMRRRGLLVVSAGLLMLGAAAATPAAWASPGRDGRLTIRLYEKPLTEHFTDLGAKGPGAGDTDVTTYALYSSPRSAKPTGHAEAVCTLVGPQAASCISTIYLPNGKIVGGAAFHFRGNGGSEHLAVLGGTGRYAGARGEVTVLVRKQDVDVIELLP
jgi:hypothetical protein